MNVSLKRYKKDFEHSYTLGVYPTIELLENRPSSVEGVLFHSKGHENTGLDIIRDLCRSHDIECQENDSGVERLTRRGDIYAVGVFRKYQPDLNPTSNHLVLVHPRGMGNLGTITRAMLAFGHKDLALVEPAADIFDPKVIRASMGALFQLRVEWFEQFPDYWGTYANHHLYPLMTDGERDLPQVSFQTPYALVFGEESSGLSPDFHQYGTSVRIPQRSEVDSLNIALSAAVTLYQASLSKE